MDEILTTLNAARSYLDDYRKELNAAAIVSCDGMARTCLHG